MRASFLKIYDGYAKLLWAAAMFAGVSTFLIMILIVLNALTRKLINIPVPASLEITQSLLVFVIMLPFAYTLWRREHVNTVFLVQSLSHQSRRWIHCFWMASGFLIFLAVTYGTFQYGLRSYRMNEQVWGATIQFPLWPSKMAVSLGTLLIAVQFLLDAIHAVLVDDDRSTGVEPIEGHAHV